MKVSFLLRRAALVFCAGTGSLCHAASTLQISSTVWTELSADERALIQRDNIVELRDPNTFGTVVDTQGVDESQPGTTGGAALGSAVANASYIDHAFKPGNNYSAKNQLAVGILGALIGSSVDRAPIAQFHFRYAIRLASGEITYRDSVQSDPFRQAAGICLEVSSLTPLPQSLCVQTATSVRATYLKGTVAVPVVVTERAPQGTAQSNVPASSAGLERVECKMTNLAPFQTSAEKCLAIGGTTQ